MSNFRTYNEVFEDLQAGFQTTFVYNNKDCGIDPYVSGAGTFDMWYGDELKVFDNFESMIKAKFFDNKTLAEISGIINFDY